MTLRRLGETERAIAYFDELMEIMKEDPPPNKAPEERLSDETAELLGIGNESVKDEGAPK
jgi:hypothetical protein